MALNLPKRGLKNPEVQGLTQTPGDISEEVRNSHGMYGVYMPYTIYLVAGLEDFYIFPYILGIINVIIPTDEVHHFSEG